MKPETFFTLLVWLLAFVAFLTMYSFGYHKGVDDQTRQLCKLYAQQDHSGEIGKERLEKMGYLWQDFNYYESCLKNSGK